MSGEPGGGLPETPDSPTADALDLHIKSLTFSDGSKVALEPKGVLALVGPNNAGKTVALRDIQGSFRHPGIGQVVAEVEVSKFGTDVELRGWLSEFAHMREPAGQRPLYSRPRTNSVNEEALSRFWIQGPPFDQLADFFVLFLGADERFNLANTMDSYDVLNEPPTNALQVLWSEPHLEVRLSLAAQEAFGSAVTVNRFAGRKISLHFGSAPPPPSSPPPLEYVKRLAQVPLVEQQGDGVRAFTGIMLALIAVRYPIVLLDEPEAFLHPPQARLLGRKIATEAKDGQVLVATHSIDVVQGLLDAPDAKVTVVRVLREGNTNPVAVLSPTDVRRLWSDPLLRASKVLDGLFHTGVVLCESDADSRFYEATLDARMEAEGRPHDLLFTHCGGKHRMTRIVDALRAVSVPVRVVGDFDVLREKTLLKDLVESLGGTWEKTEAAWSVVKAALESNARNPSLIVVREEIDKALAAAVGPTLSRDDAKAIKDVLRVEDGWGIAKQSGTSGLPAGDVSVRCGELLAYLDSIGLFLVRVGILERWFPEVPNHGPAWTADALERGVHRDTSSAASHFMGEVYRSFTE